MRLDVGCKNAQYSFPRLSLRYSFSVKPTVTLPREHIQVEIGESVQLVCNAEGSPPPDTVYE